MEHFTILCKILICICVCKPGREYTLLLAELVWSRQVEFDLSHTDLHITLYLTWMKHCLKGKEQLAHGEENDYAAELCDAAL